MSYLRLMLKIIPTSLFISYLILLLRIIPIQLLEFNAKNNSNFFVYQVFTSSLCNL